jgi:hypothetical protein
MKWHAPQFMPVLVLLTLGSLLALLIWLISLLG